MALLLIQVPVGLYMAYRGRHLNIWDGLTNAPLQLAQGAGPRDSRAGACAPRYRFSHGAPADEPTLEWWQKAASHATHWSLYLLLILVPVVGWLGISLYGARDVFGRPHHSGAGGAEPGCRQPGARRCTGIWRF